MIKGSEEGLCAEGPCSRASSLYIRSIDHGSNDRPSELWSHNLRSFDYCSHGAAPCISTWGMSPTSRTRLYWVAVKELKVSYQNPKTRLIAKDPHYGNLNEIDPEGSTLNLPCLNPHTSLKNLPTYRNSHPCYDIYPLKGTLNSWLYGIISCV